MGELRLETREAHKARMIVHASQSAKAHRELGRRMEVSQCSRCRDPFEKWAGGRRWYCAPCSAEMHYIRMDATAEVQRAIRLGVLMRADQFRCVDCDRWAECWDHRDYSKPLMVEPVCQSCNMRRGPGCFGPRLTQEAD